MLTKENSALFQQENSLRNSTHFFSIFYRWNWRRAQEGKPVKVKLDFFSFFRSIWVGRNSRHQKPWIREPRLRKPYLWEPLLCNLGQREPRLREYQLQEPRLWEPQRQDPLLRNRLGGPRLWGPRLRENIISERKGGRGFPFDDWLQRTLQKNVPLEKAMKKA